MRKPITLALTLLTLASMAQYNRTYDINGNGDNLIPSFVITNEKSETIAVSDGNDQPTTPRRDYIIVTKHDCFGNTIYNHIIYNNNMPVDGMVHVEALIETKKGELLVGGYHYDDDSHTYQPMVIKLDAAGRPMRKHIYDVNQREIVDIATNKISFCRVFDDERENYFLVASGDSDQDPGNDVVTNVIKIDESLNIIDSRKFYYQSDYSNSREYPGDIEFSERSGMYMITGYRLEYEEGGSPLQRMYFIGIDRNANPVTPYKSLHSKSIPLDQDMVYDASLDEFAVTFTHEKNGYVPALNSLIGFLRIDPALNVSNQRYIYHTDGTEHNARSISLCRSGEYAICSGIFDPDLNTHNPALIKVDNTGRPSLPLIRYNVLDDAYFGHHVTTYNCESGEEQYVLINEQRTDFREIRTDINGRACGNRGYEPRYEAYAYKQQLRDPYYEENRVERVYDPIYKALDPKVRECKGEGNSYRTAAATAISQIESDGSLMSMYPTVLSVDNARLTMVNNSSEPVKVELHNIAGQLIYSNSQVAAGTSEVQLNANGALAEGLYLLKAYNAKGGLTTTTKILITK